MRSIFTKTSGHRHQREFRFAILTNQTLEADTLDLKISPEKRTVAGQWDGHSDAVNNLRSPEFNGCMPSPRIRRCFSEWAPTHRNAGGRTEIKGTTQIRPSIHLAGVHNQNTRKLRVAEHTVEDMDYEHIEQAIADISPSPSDARIVKAALDVNPGGRITIYDLDGIDGTHRLVLQESSQLVLSSRIEVSDNPVDAANGARLLHRNFSEFDEASFLHSATTDVTLLCTQANPATTVTMACSDSGHTTITATATSEDGTDTSAFEIVFDKNLGINIGDRSRCATTTSINPAGPVQP